MKGLVAMVLAAAVGAAREDLGVVAMVQVATGKAAVAVMARAGAMAVETGTVVEEKALGPEVTDLQAALAADAVAAIEGKAALAMDMQAGVMAAVVMVETMA